MVMRYELHHPVSGTRPLVGDVEALDASKPAMGEERDEAIIRLLREKLKGRNPDSRMAAQAGDPALDGPQGEDKYEPQRLSRKICWQYDSSARKVPLLRRHYI